MNWLMNLIEILIAAWVLLCIFNFIRSVFIRASFLLKLKKQCNQLEYTFTRRRRFFSGLLFRKGTPDLIVSTKDTEYLVRFVTCFARKRFYYFVSPYFFVRYVVLHFAPRGANKELPLRLFEMDGHLPAFSEEPTEECSALKRQKVMLFNPSPVEISYAAGKEGIQIAGNGSVYEDWVIYSGGGFLSVISEKSV